MKIYLVQHGDAVSKEDDPERPLSAKGEGDVHHIAEFLKAADHKVNAVLHSGKLRAQQTAEILADDLLNNGDVEVVEGIKPNDPVQDFSFGAHNIKNDTMIVGHLPFMVKMVSYLVTGKEEPAIVAYMPGSVVCLEQDPEERWLVKWMLRPDTL